MPKAEDFLGAAPLSAEEFLKTEQPATFAERFQPMQPPSPMPWSEVGRKAISNLPSSAADYAGNIYHTIRHPIDTATALGSTALGAGQAAGVFPGESYQPYWNALRDTMASRYGSGEGFKHALATDPVGVASDVSIPATLGASGIEALPGAVARTAGAALRATDPLVAAGRAAQLGGHGLGVASGTLSGAGKLAFDRLWDAVLAGGRREQDFKNAMRHGVDSEELVNDVTAATRRMQEQASTEYNAAMQGVRGSQTYVSPHRIEGALQSVEDTGRHTVSTTGQTITTKPREAAAVAEARNLYDQFTGGMPGTAVRPADLDAFKQGLGDILDGLPFSQKNARRAITNIKQATEESIRSADPHYEQAMAGYERAMRQLEEIQKTFSTGTTRPNPDTVARKVLSAVRNNVNTNFLRRQQLVEGMDALTGRNTLDKAAGAALSSWQPRSLAAIPQAQQIQGALANLLTAASGHNPYWLPALIGHVASAAGSSPRLLGEAHNAAAQLAKYPYRAYQATPDMAKVAGRYGILGPTQQAGRWIPGGPQVSVRPYAEREAESYSQNR